MLLNERFPKRATSWRLRTTNIEFGQLPAVMGIVNVTPDSFSDGGQFNDQQQAVEHALGLVEDGADILDIGGESTRPNADPVSETEELERVVGVVRDLAERTTTPISIDTSKSKVAEEAIAAGAQIINDVTGLEGDSRMCEVALSSQAGICAMHMRGNPRTMLNDEHVQYDDVVRDICEYLGTRDEALRSAGIDPERICLDPGIGFAKTHQQNLTLLSAMSGYHELGRPILVGHSRKGFLAKILGDASVDRTHATVGVSLAMAAMGVQVLRVHDVLATRQALASFAAAGGIDGRPLTLGESNG